MASRLLNAAEEKDLENYCPLLGLRDVPLVTLEQALVPITAAVGLDADSLRALLSAARRTLKRLKKKKELRPLSEQEAMAVNIYTQESNLYRRLNGLMRQRDRNALKPLFPYLKLLLTGLHKLRPTKQTVYRGVKLHLADRYSKDDDFVWWPFTSATANVEVLQSFLGGEGKRTLFTMHVGRALDIERYSAIAVEQERMILPGTAFTVKGTLDVGGGLTIIQIAEDMEEDSLIPGFSFEKAQDAKTDKKHVAPGASTNAQRAAKAQSKLKCDLEQFEALLAACEAGRLTSFQRNHNFSAGYWRQAVAYFGRFRSEARFRYALGWCYHDGQGVARDYKEAVRLYRLAADEGHAGAQSNLGVCYHSGQGVAQDYKEAVRLYRLAADQGHAGAQCNLGYCYKNGQGVARDRAEATRLYRLAAAQGHKPSQRALRDL